MEKNNEVIQTHPLVGWDISTVDSYDALMLRLHYQTPNRPDPNGTEVPCQSRGLNGRNLPRR